MNSKIQKLTRFNRLMAVLHLAQAALVIIFSTATTFPINLSFQQFNPATSSLQLASRHLFDLRLAWIVAAFFLLSAAAHFYLGVFRPQRYARNLQNQVNPVRWYEYALSASIMMVAIAILAGMEDLASLLLVFGLTAVMNLCGLIMERSNKPGKQTNWLSFWVGSLAGILPWLAVGLYFYGAESAAGTNIPTFVYWIYVSIFIFFNCFALNMVAQYKGRGKWKDYLYGERVYIILSLVAKSALSWQIFFGTLRP